MKFILKNHSIISKWLSLTGSISLDLVAVNVVSLAERVHDDDVGEGDEVGVDKALWAKSKTISEFLESFASWCC